MLLYLRTGAIQIGDRVLAINAVPTSGKTLTQATNMLFDAGDLVTLKIARHDKPGMYDYYLVLTISSEGAYLP